MVDRSNRELGRTGAAPAEAGAPGARGPNGAQSRPLDLSLFRRAILEQWPTLVAFAGSVFVAALVVSLLTPRLYDAQAVIQLLPRAGREVDLAQAVRTEDGGYMESRDRARTQIQIIQSRGVAEEVLQRYAAQGQDDLPATPEGADALLRALSAGPREDTQLVEIHVLNRDPERAALLANLVAQVYVERNLEARREVAAQSRDWLGGQTETYRQSLDSATQAVMSFKAEHNLADIDESTDSITSRLSSLQTAIAEANTQAVLLESSLRSHQRLQRDGHFDVLVGMIEDPALETMAKERAMKAAATAEVLSRYGELHPEHRRAVDALAQLDTRIRQEVDRNIEGERAALGNLKRQGEKLQEELDRVKGELLERQRLSEQYSALKLEEDRVRRLYGSLGEREAEVGLQARTELNDVHLVDEARAPSSPAKPNIPLNLAMALLVGAAGGFGLALLRLRLDDRVRGAAALRDLAEAPFLGELPSVAATVPPDRRALESHENPGSLMAEALQQVRAALHPALVPGAGLRVLVTSALEDEGRTDVAVGLAIGFARLGMSTLLIDADLRQPRLHAVFGQPQGPGLVEATKGVRGDPLRYVRSTPMPDLHLLTSGGPAEFPGELLASVEVDLLLSRAGEAYRLVIIDSPPASLVSDARQLSRSTDAVLLVARRGRVTRKEVEETVDQLRRAGAWLAGVVLNDVPPRAEELRYRASLRHASAAAAPSSSAAPLRGDRTP
jgi:succinoglycan biosynthesis transport protein ExoP